MTVAINGVKIDGLRSMTELSGLQTELDTVQQRQDGNTIVKKLPGRTKAGTLVLTRAMTNDDSLREWHKNVVSGRKDRRSVDITLYSEDGRPLRTYHFMNCWPIRYSPGNLGRTSGVGKEKIELTYESVRVQ